MPSEETKSQFDQLAFDANAAIDSLRPERPFPYPLKAARQLFMPPFVLADCLQYQMPLLTNDALFAQVIGLQVVNW